MNYKEHFIRTGIGAGIIAAAVAFVFVVSYAITNHAYELKRLASGVVLFGLAWAIGTTIRADPKF